MNKYVSLDKRSKKAQREYHAKQRRTWGELNPVTRSVPSGKTYNRKKEKQRIGKEFRNGFEADLFLVFGRFFSKRVLTVSRIGFIFITSKVPVRLFCVSKLSTGLFFYTKTKGKNDAKAIVAKTN